MKLSRLFSSRPNRPTQVVQERVFKRLSLKALPKTIYAVGDVHGCLEAFQVLEEKLVKDAQENGNGDQVLLVLLGDLIDRGADSAGLIDHLLKPAPKSVTRICLMGNHEDMLLNFIKSPEQNASWLDYGGRETLASYGVHSDILKSGKKNGQRLSQIVEAHIPQTHVDFIAALPVSLSLPGWFFCHSGLNPAVALDQQAKDDLLWTGHGPLDASPIPKLTVVHGHTPVETVDVRPHRICVDTGAYSSGKLSAIKIVDGKYAFSLSNLA